MRTLLQRYRRHVDRASQGQALAERSRHGSRGQSLTELAIVTPVLLLLVMGAIDLGRVFYAQISLENAAREGAMVAASNPTSYSAGAACDASSNAVICAATREGLGGFVTVDPTDVTLACDPSCAKTYGTTVAVAVTGHFTVLTPLVWVFTGGPSVTFERSATADVVITPAGGGAPTPSPSPSPSPTPSPTPSPSPTGGGPTPSPSPSPSSSPSPSPTPFCANPFVGFTYTQQNKNKPVVFTSTSTPTTGLCAISYWRWEFGDGIWTAGAVPTASHDYSQQGTTFNVTLTVTTPAGTFSYIAPVTTQ